MKDTSVLKNRNLYIGGSDVPIILNISPFKTRYDLLFEKAGLKDVDFQGNIYTDFGVKLEPKIRNYINDNFYPKNKFSPDCKILGNFRGNCDGKNTTSILEIKTTSKIHKNVDDYEVYLVQLLKYMELYKKDIGVLAVYNRPDDFDENFDCERLQIFEIDIKNYEDLLYKINEEIDKFLIDLEKIKENPFLTEEDLIPKDITVFANAVLKLEDDVIKAKTIIEKYEDEKEKLKSAMLVENIKRWETPNGIKFTIINGSKDVEVDVFDEERFKKEQEELFNKYQIKKIKKGKVDSLRITIPKIKK